MSPEISEHAFEEAIECALLHNGPDACPGDATAVRAVRALESFGRLLAGAEVDYARVGGVRMRRVLSS